MGESNLLTLRSRSFGESGRSDRWWIQPLVVLLGFSTFIAYSTWAAFQAETR